MIKNLVVFSLLLFCSLSFAQSKGKNIDLAVGIDQPLKIDYQFRTDRVLISNESVVKITSISPKRREIVLSGRKSGQTSMTIYNTKTDEREIFVIKVTADGLSNVVRELRELVGDVEGVKIGIKGGKVVVEGEVVVPTQIGRIQTVLARYPDVLVLLDYAPQTQLLVAKEMQEAIKKNDMNDVAVRVVNGEYWLEGVVNSDARRALAKTIADAYRPDTVVGLSNIAGGDRINARQKGGIRNFISVNAKKDPEPPKKLVKISAQFVELAKDYSKVFAFKWAPFMSTNSSISFGKTGEGTVGTSENGTLSGTISRLFPKLTSAKEAGYARVIQSGMIVTTDGKEAKINKSSKQSFAIGSGENADTGEAETSFSMSTTPSIQAQEAINLGSLNISVSLPNGNTNTGNPLSTSNSINTHIVVKAKESAVVGGIVQNTSSTAYDKNDPDPTQPKSDDGEQATSLFNVLRSKAYKTTKTQFVVFVTPEILESASVGTEEIRKKFRKRER